MPALWPFSGDEALWAACVGRFERYGIELPIVPDALDSLLRMTLRPCRSGCFTTVGWHRSESWQSRIDDAVARPEPMRAWLGINPERGEPLAELSLVMPHLGLFLRHRRLDPSDAGSGFVRTQEACRSAGRLLWDADKIVRSGRWPPGQRLLLIDDDLDLPRWGWLDLGAEVPAISGIRVMKVSHAIYDEVNLVLAALDHRASGACVN